MDPILTTISAALAKEAVSGGKDAFGRLVRFVREKFAKDPGAEIVLASARENPEDERWIDTLARVLDRTGEADPEFAARLRELWATAKTEVTAARVDLEARDHGHINSIVNSSGINVQARYLNGDITTH
jgi:hypothetical protein